MLIRTHLIDYRNLQRPRSDFPIRPTRKRDRHPRLALNRCVRDPHGAVKAILSATLVERGLDMDQPGIAAGEINLQDGTEVLGDRFMAEANEAANP